MIVCAFEHSHVGGEACECAGRWLSLSYENLDDKSMQWFVCIAMMTTSLWMYQVLPLDVIGLHFQLSSYCSIIKTPLINF